MSKGYYKFSTYFKNKGLKERVQKVTVDAGFSCPNRDGKISDEGCIYCNNEGFSPNTRKAFDSIERQIHEGIKRSMAKKFIVYFQAYTNTYAPLERLKEVYDTARKFKDVIGISIATRPDCVTKDIIDLIELYTKDYEVWVEYGLQTIHKKTLEFINRGHLYEDFLKAVDLTRKKDNIKICAHVIIGLPFEDEGMIIETARSVANLKLEGIKIHPLHIIKGTRLEELYRVGKFKVLELEEYIDLAVKFLEHLWPETVIQRISADCPRDLLVAPLWILDKSKVLAGIEQKDTFQGRLYKETA
ncbi:MAG: TIGR01212 family radical SAM protein [Candidatus Omnitrophica bacterium]|nr:TIGR01212 family radical SAM protein [Candidatus Omnitrophota bacterium]